MLGMNSHGIANVSNSVHSNDNRIGVPNVFVRRATLEARTLEEARDRGLLAARARGTNQFFADTGGRLWDLETSATAHAPAWTTRPPGSWRTPTTTSRRTMRPTRAYATTESPVRLATAERLLRGGHRRAARTPWSSWPACCARTSRLPTSASAGTPTPDEPPADQGMTVGSMICDLDERRLYACAGPPCENPYQVFEMERTP